MREISFENKWNSNFSVLIWIFLSCKKYQSKNYFLIFEKKKKKSYFVWTDLGIYFGN